MICFFCLGEIYPEQAHDEHHVIPKRYGGKRKVGVHKSCHQRWNREHDRQKMDKDSYLIYLKAVNEGEGIFKALA